MISDLLFSAAFSYISFESSPYNASQMIHVTFDSIVDVSKSKFICDDQILIPENNELYFTVSEEHDSSFGYILKDKDGNLLEKNEKKIKYDIHPPVIHCFVKNHELLETIYVNESIDISILVEDENIKDVIVYIDDQLVKDVNLESILVNKDMKSIRIEATDIFGRKSYKFLSVQPLENPKCNFSVLNNAYVLDSKIKIKSEDINLNRIHIYFNGEYLSELKLNQGEEIQFDMQKTGDYEFRGINDLYPYLELNLGDMTSFLVHFSNKPLTLQFVAEHFYSNNDILVHIDWTQEYLESSYLEIYNGKEWIRRDLIDNIVFAAIPNQQIQYYAHAVVKDKFGRIMEQEIHAMTDQKSPILEVDTEHGILSDCEINYISKDVILNFKTDEKANITYKLKLNGQLMDSDDLNQVIQRMSEKDLLEIDCTAIDNVKNRSNRKYKVKVVPYQFKENKVATIVEVPGFFGNSEKEHVFEVKDKKIIHKIKKKKQMDQMKPDIHFIQKNQNTMRILLLNEHKHNDNYFDKISVNDKEINLKKVKKDMAGNPYYDLKKVCGTYNVHVIAKDQSGNKTIANRKVFYSIPFEKVFLISGLFLLILSTLIGSMLRWKHG